MLAAALLALGPGCSLLLDFDVPPVDAAANIDAAPLDATPIDAAAPDGSPVDATPVDASVPDGNTTTAAALLDHR